MNQNNPKNYPILKYAGGKFRELNIIKQHLPKSYHNYYEPFVGGGAVWLNIHANHYYINDLSSDLMNLYKYIQDKDPKFIKIVQSISRIWSAPIWNKLINSNPKILISPTVQIKHFKEIIYSKILNQSQLRKIIKPVVIKKSLNKAVKSKIRYLQRKKKKYGYIIQPQVSAITSIKEALYNIYRYIFNNITDKRWRVATYWLLKENAYSAMSRFNKHGQFNVPYGGSSYNNKSIETKLKRALSGIFQNKLQKTTLSNSDFHKALLEHQPQPNDFVFLDPPYDMSFASYGNHKFGKNKQIELAHYLKYECKAQFMLVIKATPLIDKLYKPNESVISGIKKLKIGNFNKQYQFNFHGRNNQKATHLLITNY